MRDGVNPCARLRDVYGDYPLDPSLRRPQAKLAGASLLVRESAWPLILGSATGYRADACGYLIGPLRETISEAEEDLFEMMDDAINALDGNALSSWLMAQ